METLPSRHFRRVGVCGGATGSGAARDAEPQTARDHPGRREFYQVRRSTQYPGRPDELVARVDSNRRKKIS